MATNCDLDACESAGSLACASALGRGPAAHRDGPQRDLDPHQQVRHRRYVSPENHDMLQTACTPSTDAALLWLFILSVCYQRCARSAWPTSTWAPLKVRSPTARRPSGPHTLRLTSRGNDSVVTSGRFIEFVQYKDAPEKDLVFIGIVGIQVRDRIMKRIMSGGALSQVSDCATAPHQSHL